MGEREAGRCDPPRTLFTEVGTAAEPGHLRRVLAPPSGGIGRGDKQVSG